MKEIEFNINDFVKVKLTDLGKKIHADYWADTFKNYDFLYQAPKEDEEGYSKWQMWDLMKLFGDHLYNGCNIPFETTIKLEVK